MQNKALRIFIILIAIMSIGCNEMDVVSPTANQLNSTTLQSIDNPLMPLFALLREEGKIREKLYYGTIVDVDHIYDGDTIGRTISGEFHGVSVRIYPECDSGIVFDNDLWLGIECRKDGIFAVTKIRIAGIDAPERIPAAQGRSIESRNREKERAATARKFLQGLFLKYNKHRETIGFALRVYYDSKYGDPLADIILFNDEAYIDVGTKMIENGHAVPYFGGTKTHDWGAE
ncbi:MAG: hypothetical protein OXI67_01395 [Candidatus Poribacteria bacterium]|nr:hypothetical protein [Candidatus Poribacteria bacterium]